MSSSYFKVCLCDTKIGESLHLKITKNHSSSWLFFLALLVSFLSQAQYTGVINANNPGFAESPYSVGSGVYQFESNLFTRNTSIEPVFSSPDSYGMQLQYRMSYFFEELEFQANLGFQNDQVAFRNIFTSTYRQTGLSTLSFGAKYLLYERKFIDKTKEIRSWKKRNSFDWNRLIPSVAVFGGFNTNLVSEVHKTQGMTARFGLLLQNDFSPNFNLITNVFYDHLGSNDAQISLVVSGTYSFTDRWSTFLEYQNIFRQFVNDVNFGTGLAFLYNRNIQINGSLRYLIEGEAKGYYMSLGLAYRIDKHLDPEIEYDEVGNRITGRRKQKNPLEEKKGVGKLLDKINIFKKGENNKETELSERTIKSIEQNINVNDKTLYLERKEKGLPIRTRPKRVRIKPGKYRPVKEKKDTSKKDKEKADKEEEKEDKAKAKARRRAEKEVDRILKREAREREKAKKKQEKEEKEKEEEKENNDS